MDKIYYLVSTLRFDDNWDFELTNSSVSLYFNTLPKYKDDILLVNNYTMLLSSFIEKLFVDCKDHTTKSKQNYISKLRKLEKLFDIKLKEYNDNLWIKVKFKNEQCKTIYYLQN